MQQPPIDFLSPKIRHRCQTATLRNELLARAIGFRPKENPRIIDATAGLGRDGFILAALGFHVTLLERSSLLVKLLDEAFERAKHDPTIAPIIERLQLIETDAITWLQTLPQSERPHVIYLDPMFPSRQKTAAVKKEMVILQDLLGKDTDADQLLQVALTCATKRVVVKRPRLAKALSEQMPHFSLKGKSSRFDIYLI